MVSGGGTNLQAILDAIDSGSITNAQVVAVLSNNPGAYALERARKHNIPAECLSPRDFESREAFNQAFLEKVDSYNLDLIVLAGFLVTIPPAMTQKGWIRARFFYRRQWRYFRMIRQKLFSGVLWRRQNGSFCLRPLI